MLEFLHNNLQYLLSGISVGGQYALIAIGYTMVYGILRLINFAHGDVFMVAGLIMIYAVAGGLPLWAAIILMIALMPYIRKLIGTGIGTPATTAALIVAAAPFVARMVESSISEVDPGVVEAAKTMGATNWQIAYSVLIPEAVPSLIRGFSITTITLIGYSAMAGAFGAGGLGDIAIRYGYYRYG